MSNLGDRIRQCRESMGLTQEKLASCAETSRATINALENDIRGMRPDINLVLRIAKCLHSDGFWLLTGEGSRIENVQFDKVKMIEIISWNEVKSWKKDDHMRAHLAKRELIAVPQPCPDNCFALTIRDDSMVPNIIDGDGFKPDEIIIIDPDIKPKNDSFVVVSIAQAEPVLRKFFETASGFALKPLNTKYPTEMLREDTTIHGVVVAKMSNIQRFN